MNISKSKHKSIEKNLPATDISPRRNLTALHPQGSSERSNRNVYDHKNVERYWQTVWEKEGLNSPDMSDPKNKFFNLWMFPYPSAEGLHAGHAFASTGSDVIGRFKRMNGYNVFQPIGYDSFGIHSENFALKINEHPAKMITRTTKHYEDQMRSLGHAYDWTRTVTTSDPDYYRWTQWLFVQMFKAGLAYKKKAEVNWCPSCKTVLSDEQVVTPAAAGKDPKNASGETVVAVEGMQVCERCATLIERKELEQWFVKITDYADKLLDGLETLKWPEKIKTAQRNWIGKKDWIDIKYPIEGTDEEIVVSTTRPDTNFGATFIVLSCEHPLVDKIINGEIKVDKSVQISISEYVQLTKSKSDIERIAEGREKSGVNTQLYATNQLNGYKLPIFITDFVLISVGTGAVVGVPGHDRRDFEFAKKFDLPVVRVVVGKDGDRSEITKLEQVQEEEGKIINSDFLNGLDIHDATKKIMDHLEVNGWGKRLTRYHLRDWLLSRQRYWGPPIPMIYCEKCAKEGKSFFTEQNENNQKYNLGHSESKTVEEKKPLSPIGNWKLEIGNSTGWKSVGWYPVPEDQLPVTLPDIPDFKPEGTGKGPLAKHPEFYKTKCPGCGGEAERETDVSDTFLDSAWYFLRYPSVKEKPSTLEIGNCLRLREPSGSESKLEIPWNCEVTQSWLPVDLYFGGAEHAVLHLMYSRFVWKMLVDAGFVDSSLGYEPFPRFYAHGLMIKDGAKMSKSRGNVVNPDEYVEKFGADALRLYLMFMGPMDGYPDFRDTGIEGMRKFVERVWGLFDLVNHSEDSLSEPKESLSEKFHLSNLTNSSDINVSRAKESKQSANEGNEQLTIKMHQTIKKVTEDILEFKYNTAISAIMEYVNALKEQTQPVTKNLLPVTYLETLALLLAPFTPHFAEELWQKLNGQTAKLSNSSGTKKQSKEAIYHIPNTKFQSVHIQPWPSYDPKLVIEETVTIPIQVNGKLRGTIEVERGKISDEKFVLLESKCNKIVQKWIEGKDIKKEIYIYGRLVNFVI